MKTSELIEAMVRHGSSFYVDTDMEVTKYGWVSFRMSDGTWVASVNTGQPYNGSFDFSTDKLTESERQRISKWILDYIWTPLSKRGDGDEK